MYKHPVVASAVGLLAVCAFLLLCCGATWLGRITTAQPQALSTTVPEETELYRNQGLGPNAVLQSVPEEITEEQVNFTDRVLLRCSWTQEEEDQGIAALQTMLGCFENLAQPVNCYVMTVPLRIGFEQNFSTDEAYLEIVASEHNRLQELEKRILESAADQAICIPLMDTLERHREEYLFFRSDYTWTALGAYYGAQEFLRAAGLETFPLDTFYETAKTNIIGSLADPSGTIFDRLYTYQYRYYNPPVDWPVEGKRQPLISLIRGGVGIFTGVGEVGIFQGLADNGRALLLMGEKNGAVLAPWMVTQFERVVFVDLRRYSPENLDFWQLMQQWQITDVLMLEDTSQIASSRTVGLFETLAQQRHEEPAQRQ